MNEVLDDMRANTERLAHLIDQLLALNRAEARSAVAMEAIDLAEFGRQTTFESLPVALAKSIDLGFEGETPVSVAGNKVLLHELLATLIDNALRFTPDHGHVTVSVTHGETLRAVIEVEDTGRGFPRAERERVFDRFYQIPGRASTGFGLGLAIAREIATIHGATLSIREPRLTQGTRVVVEFP
jgi:two-component system sensor histidine kinase TctE